MKRSDPNMVSVELVATALGELREELVLVGGCSVGLLITDSARPTARPRLLLRSAFSAIPSCYVNQTPYANERRFISFMFYPQRWEPSGICVR
jgi:hypothetical protein